MIRKNMKLSYCRDSARSPVVVQIDVAYMTSY